MGRGRPRKAGPRNGKGRLVVLVDRGNDRVQQRAAVYACFQQGKAGEHIRDQIGRVWAVGLLDGYEIDAAILRDKGREYGERYWQEMAELAPRVGQSERRPKGKDNDNDEDRPGERFMVLDTLARAYGRPSFSAVQDLCVNEYWFPDTNRDWVDRLINMALLKAGRPVAGELERDGDRRKMQDAVKALIAMADGNKPKEISFSLVSVA